MTAPPEHCFVLMPFESSRRDRLTTSLDFDELYSRLIAPAVRDASLEPIRADQELQGGIFHKTMFERLATCSFAVADLSLANPNVFYELGIRHALRPWSTVLLFQENTTLPLDVALDAAMTYRESVLEDPALLALTRGNLTARLRAAEAQRVDSPVFQLVAGLQTHEVDHRRADVLVESATRDNAKAQRVLEAERSGHEALSALRSELGDLRQVSPEVVSALVMAFRAQERWDDMVDAITTADPGFGNVWVIREQLAIAHGRRGDYRQAIDILERLLKKRPNSESYGILGGIYKRQWKEAITENRSTFIVRGLRQMAVEAYRAGFDCDWRDPYPGVNAVMIGATISLEDTLRDPLLGAVNYALNRRLARADPEYWDFACAVELAVVEGRTANAEDHLPSLLLRMEQPFQKTATLADLSNLREISESHGQGAWHADLIREIEAG